MGKLSEEIGREVGRNTPLATAVVRDWAERAAALEYDAETARLMIEHKVIPRRHAKPKGWGGYRIVNTGDLGLRSQTVETPGEAVRAAVKGKK